MRIGVRFSTAWTTASAIAWSGRLTGCARRRKPSASFRARSASVSGMAATIFNRAVRASRAQGVSSSRRSPMAVATASASVKLSGGSVIERSSR